MHMPSDETEQYDEPETIVQRGGGGGDIRGPQSVQSVPRVQSEYSAPAPPSSQRPSEAKLHVSEQVCALEESDGEGGDGDGGGGDGDIRGPQSVQSVPRVQSEYWAPGPPSSHQPSEA